LEVGQKQKIKLWNQEYKEGTLTVVMFKFYQQDLAPEFYGG